MVLGRIGLDRFLGTLGVSKSGSKCNLDVSGRKKSSISRAKLGGQNLRHETMSWCCLIVHVGGSMKSSTMTKYRPVKTLQLYVTILPPAGDSTRDPPYIREHRLDRPRDAALRMNTQSRTVYFYTLQSLQIGTSFNVSPWLEEVSIKPASVDTRGLSLLYHYYSPKNPKLRKEQRFDDASLPFACAVSWCQNSLAE